MLGGDVVPEHNQDGSKARRDTEFDLAFDLRNFSDNNLAPEDQRLLLAGCSAVRASWRSAMCC